MYIKDLRVIKNRNIDNLLLVDNAAYSYNYQMENGVPIVSFYDDRNDKELFKLEKYIKDVITKAEMYRNNQSKNNAKYN